MTSSREGQRVRVRVRVRTSIPGKMTSSREGPVDSWQDMKMVRTVAAKEGEVSSRFFQDVSRFFQDVPRFFQDVSRFFKIHTRQETRTQVRTSDAIAL